MPEQPTDSPDLRLAHALFDECHYGEALPLFLKEGGRGDMRALYWAGRCYNALYSDGENPECGPLGLDCFQRAADGGDMDALLALGHCHRWGMLGLPENGGEAFRIYSQAAEKASAEGVFLVAECYKYGIGVAENRSEAVRHCMKAAHMGNIAACHEMAWRSRRHGGGVLKSPSMAAKYYSIAAEQGDNEARYMLGCCYREGYGVEPDAAKAFHLFQLVGENPTLHERACGSRAWLALGRCYEQGSGTAVDLGKAVYWYRKAAQMDMDEAFYELGRCWEAGIVLPRDRERALALYRFAERNNVAAASLALARYYEGEGADPEKAAYHRAKAERNATDESEFRYDGEPESYGPSIDWDSLPPEEILERAAGGDRHARRRAGMYCNNVLGDKVEAARWYRLAVEQGDGPSAFYLSKYYAAGEGGLEKDPAKSMELVRFAAEKGFVCALCYMGDACKDGDGVPQDKPEALRWYLKAKDEGCRWAMGELGLLQESGDGVPQDTAEAYKNFFIAAGRGHAESQMKLATAFEKGVFLPRDPVRARWWYRQAAAHGVAEAAQRRKAVLDMPTGDVPPAPDRSARFQSLQQAAERGDMAALGQVGWCYLKGRGVRKSAHMAVVSFRSAAATGDASACYGLGVCYLRGRGVGKDPQEALLWLRRAACRRLAAAQISLARHLAGTKRKEDLEEALHWYRAAVREGSVVAECELGGILLYGRYVYGESGACMDYVEGRRWLHQAANHGSARAMFYLGRRHHVPLDSESYGWCRLAAECGDPDAQLLLARHFEKSDPKLARKWCRAAARNGNPDAKNDTDAVIEVGG